MTKSDFMEFGRLHLQTCFWALTPFAKKKSAWASWERSLSLADFLSLAATAGLRAMDRTQVGLAGRFDRISNFPVVIGG